MEFIKRMKKREFIEMGLKALAGLLLAFIAVILMEGMIYSITLNAYVTKGNTATTQDGTVVYCFKNGQNEDNEDLYSIICYNENATENGATSDWSSTQLKKTKDVIIEDYVNKDYKVVWHAPSAFEFTMSPVHYIVISIFIAGVVGFFVYRFIKLALSYKEVEETYEKTGTIEITNK